MSMQHATQHENRPPTLSRVLSSAVFRIFWSGRFTGDNSLYLSRGYWSGYATRRNAESERAEVPRRNARPTSPPGRPRAEPLDRPEAAPADENPHGEC